MSRTASTSTQQTSSSGSASTPSLSRTTTQASSLPSFSPSNPIDDFVLFPEDDSSWNTDISFPELETQDLGQFNFDINVDLNDYLPTTDSVFDFSFDQQPQVQPQFDYTPAMNDQYGLDQWAEPQGFQPVSHSRPHPASFMNGSAELDANWQSGWLQAESLISPRTSTFTDNYWPNSVDHPQVPQSSTSNNQPLLSDTADWSLLESTLVHSTGGATNNELSQASQPRRSRKRRAESSEPLTSDIGILDPSDRQRSERVQYQAVSRTSPTNSSLEQGDSSAGCARVSGDIARLQNSAQLVSKSLRRIKRAPQEYISLGEDLQQLEGALTRLQSSQHAETILSASEIATLRSLTAQLQALSSRGVEQSRSLSANRRRNKLSQGMRPDYAQQLQVTVRRLVRSLCATINAVEAQNTGTISPTDNRPILTSGRNLQLQVSSSEPHDHERLSPVSGSDVQMSGSSSMQNSRRSATGSGIAASAAVLQRYNGNVESLDICTDVEGVCSPTRNERGSVASELLTASGMPRYSMLVKSTLSDLLPQGVEGSRPIERSELTERDILAGTDPVRLPSRLSSTFTPDEAHSRTSFSGQARSRMDFLLEEQTGGLATSQHGRTIGTTTPTSTDRALRADNVETRPSASSTLAAHNSASTKEVLPFRRNVENSYQAEISQEPSSTVLQTLPPGVVETQYSFAGALAILGSIALASSVWHPPCFTHTPPLPFHFLTFTRSPQD
jgi:hypothetical protein